MKVPLHRPRMEREESFRKAASSKRLSYACHLPGSCAKSTASSAQSRSVNTASLSATPRLPEHLDMIQSIARQNSAGASIHPCRTPEEVWNAFDSFLPTRTRDVVPVCKSWISWIRNCGAPVARSAFQRAWRVHRAVIFAVAQLSCYQYLLRRWTMVQTYKYIRSYGANGGNAR